jgi:uncharacterized iron-regulated membrane protein
MSRDEALQLICDAIVEIQQKSGRPVVVLTEISRPFVDVAGFDSLNGEEVTALLSEKLSFAVDFNPFFSASHGDLTIGEIADRLVSNAAVKQEVP